MRKQHGHSRTKLYSRWKGMRLRCSNKKDKRYSDYGGRGITVCKRWDSFDTVEEAREARDLAISVLKRGDVCLSK